MPSIKFYMYGARVEYINNEKIITNCTEPRFVTAKSEYDATLRFIETHFDLVSQFKGEILEFYMLKGNHYVQMSLSNK